MARRELDKDRDKLGDLFDKSEDNFKELYQKTEGFDHITEAFDEVFHQNVTEKVGEE